MITSVPYLGVFTDSRFAQGAALMAVRLTDLQGLGSCEQSPTRHCISATFRQDPAAHRQAYRDARANILAGYVDLGQQHGGFTKLTTTVLSTYASLAPAYARRLGFLRLVSGVTLMISGRFLRYPNRCMTQTVCHTLRMRVSPCRGSLGLHMVHPGILDFAHQLRYCYHTTRSVVSRRGTKAR